MAARKAGKKAKRSGKPFGGYTVSFGKVSGMTLGNVFGTGKITPSAMTKKLWAVIKSKKLAGK
ncbi:hypothetical protein COU38_00410 [Candidatus Micrarchaeota archaeon CG10_big_fil_rev_8_21_14_0_10_54_18]|nr:MAG: hypothetical protein AUJ15_01195 [Candidatus Micrarchaeota archaeon CG1_02_55_41]PIO03054.1 MAG: hypothetical protein COT57_01110 [Candidatus Micrarchaeota archaeon CG09_land_8_20_14_0_10_55_25]PJD01538.1 MAG: hypothetical protein COU38_00410 [Candidatus Micrarchaeota archaeon CG10_big_fil_rev_8_21_14_0_10_54_18]